MFKDTIKFLWTREQNDSRTSTDEFGSSINCKFQY